MKIINKIIGACLGIAMITGVGLGMVIGNKESVRTEAADEESLTINADDFNTTSYAANNGEHITGNIQWYSKQVMKQSNEMQWQKNTGYIYNMTDLGTIKSVMINSSSGSFTTYYGNSSYPTDNTVVSGGYFTIQVGNATGKTTSIIITYESKGGDTPTSEPVGISTICFKVILSDNDLIEGAKYIIANNEADAVMGAQNSNNRSVMNNSAVNTIISVNDTDTCIVTLGITNEHYTFDTGEGFLYAASSSKNYLKTQKTNNANGEWSIIYTDGIPTIIAQGDHTHNILRYNSSDHLFACYAQGQKDVALYKLDFSETFKHNIICDDLGNHTLENENTWSDLESIYNDLPANEKNVISDEVLIRYDYIVGKYNYKDFMSRDPIQFSSSKLLIVHNPTVSIFIIATIGLILITGAAFWYFRKNKSEKISNN